VLPGTAGAPLGAGAAARVTASMMSVVTRRI
jgi:hypothetical protein